MFTPTYPSLDERQPWSNVFYNQFVLDVAAALATINGVNLAAPVVLSKVDQHLNGSGHYLYNFKRWFGAGTDVSMRDAAGFGATGQGAVDDVDALQRAIDDLPVTGGCVLIPPGTYKISSRTLRLSGSDPGAMKSNVTLRGCGLATILKLGDASNRDLLTFGQGASGCVLEDLVLDGNTGNQTSEVVNVDASGTTNCRVRRVSSTYAKGAGFKVGASTNLHLRDCLALSCKNGLEHGLLSPASGLLVSGLFALSCSNDGVVLGPINGAVLSQIISANNGRRGFMITSSTAGGANLFSLSACQAAANTENGIHIEAVVNNAMVGDFVLCDCQAFDNTGHGILLLGIISAPIRGFSLASCLARSNGGEGIRLSQQVADGSIGGCLSTHNTGKGLLLEGAGAEPSIERVTVDGGSYYDTGTATQTHGVHLSALTRNCVVVASSCYGNTTAQILDEGVDNDVSHNP